MRRKKQHALGGLRVLVGRARRQASPLSKELRALGAEVIEIPFIEIRKPHSLEAMDRALRNIGQYDWLVLTSVNGVEALGSRLKKLRIDLGKTKHLKVAAIGPATRARIRKLGLRVTVMPKEYVAESVVAALRGKVEGKKVLLARAKEARDLIPRELRKLGAQVDVAQAYQTVMPSSSKKRLEWVMQDSKLRPDLVCFTSPSTVRNFVKLLSPQNRAPLRKLGGVRFASIGPVTSRALRDFGLPVHVQATKYTIPGLIQAIRNKKNKLQPAIG